MAIPSLTSYVFRVFSGDPDNPREDSVRSVGADIQRTESFFADRKWGSTQDRPMTAAAVTAWYAMKRAHTYDGTWEQFQEWYLSVEPEESVISTPTVAGAAPA